MGKGSQSGSGLRNVGTLGAALVLIVAGGCMLAVSSRHPGQAMQAAASLTPSLAASQSTEPDVKAILSNLPLIFEPNRGQAEAAVKFLAHGAGYSLLLDSSGATLSLQPATSGAQPDSVRMRLVGASPNLALDGTGPLPGKSNYLLGSNPDGWHTGIPQFSGVRYPSLYPGIDLVFYGNQGRLEYDFQVAPGGDPERAQVEFEGASKVELSQGEVVVDEGRVRLHAPRIYQRYGEREQAVDGHFVLRAANRVAFDIGAYDHSRELVIDPQLSFATYFGGSGTDTSPFIGVDTVGNIYIAGSTTSSAGFPIGTTTPTQLGPSAHIFVAEITPSNPPIVPFITFLGGSGADTSQGLAVDGAGNVYLAGNTTSPDFPTSSTARYQGAPETKTQTCTGTCNSIFLSVLSGGSLGGTFDYSSYLSGNGNDLATGLAIDTNRNAYLTGTTTSTDTPTLTDSFPASNTPLPFQNAPKPGSSIQFFVTKVNTASTGVGSIAYSTYFGGGTPSGATATGGGVSVDTTGNIYFDGTTNFTSSGTQCAGCQTSDFPLVNAYQPCLDQPPPTVITYPVTCANASTNTDAFVAKLNPNAPPGTQLQFSTYLGGSGTDSAAGIIIDSGAANIFLTGTTNSPDFVLPTGTGAFQTCLNAPPTGSPLVNPSPCPSPANTSFTDAYVARLSNPSEGTTISSVALTYFSYLGGSNNDTGNAISVDTASGALVTGATSSTDFPVVPNPGAIQTTLNGVQNAYFARINTTTVSGQTVGSYATYYGGNAMDRGTSVTVDNQLNTYFAGDTTSANLQTADALQTTLNGPSDAFVVRLGTAADLQITGKVIYGTGQTSLSAGNPVSLQYTVTNNGPDLATQVFVSAALPSGIGSVTATANSGSCTTASTGSVGCTIATLQSGGTSTISISVTPTTAGGYTIAATVTAVDNNDPITGNNTAALSFTATDFSLAVNPTSQTVVAGGTTSYQALLSPLPVFGSSVTLSCSSGMPSQSACTPSSASVTLNGPVGVQLNVATTARPVTTASTEWRGPLYAAWIVVPGLALFGIGAGNRRGKRMLGMLMLCVVFGSVMLLPSCGGKKTVVPPSGTPSGTYTVTVTATSGSLSHSQTFSLTVQ